MQQLMQQAEQQNPHCQRQISHALGQVCGQLTLDGHAPCFALLGNLWQWVAITNVPDWLLQACRKRSLPLAQLQPELQKCICSRQLWITRVYSTHERGQPLKLWRATSEAARDVSLIRDGPPPFSLL